MKEEEESDDGYEEKKVTPTKKKKSRTSRSPETRQLSYTSDGSEDSTAKKVREALLRGGGSDNDSD